MYRVLSARFTAGRMMTARLASLLALESISAQRRWCASVVAFTRTIGASASSERSTSVIGAAPVTPRSTAGTRSTMLAPGLKPSFRL